VISPASIDVKEMVPIGGAQADFDALPEDVRLEALAALTDLQNGRWPTGGRYKNLTGNDKLAGVGEIRLNQDGDTYRIYTVVAYREVLYLLDAGIKKSVRGGAIPQQDVSRLEKRCKSAKDDYKENLAAYQIAYAERAERRRRHFEAIEAKMQALRVRKPKGT
jgi:phage-related protein